MGLKLKIFVKSSTQTTIEFNFKSKQRTSNVIIHLHNLNNILLYGFIAHICIHQLVPKRKRLLSLMHLRISTFITPSFSLNCTFLVALPPLGGGLFPIESFFFFGYFSIIEFKGLAKDVFILKSVY